LVLGIYGGNITKLSIKSCFEQAHNWELESQSVVWGLVRSQMDSIRSVVHDKTVSPFIKTVETTHATSFSFEDGLHTLTNALANQLKKSTDLLTSTTGVKLNFDASQSSPFELVLDNARTIKADYVFSSLPAHATASILPSSPLTQALNDIQFASLAVVNIGYNSEVIPRKYRGFGYLIPPSEEQQILGVTFDSYTFPVQNNSPEETRMTVMLGGDKSISDTTVDVERASDQELKDIALSSIKQHIGITEKPAVITVSRSIKAIPQYCVGHSENVAKLKALSQSMYDRRLHLYGSSYKGAGLVDAVMNAENLAKHFELFNTSDNQIFSTVELDEE